MNHRSRAGAVLSRISMRYVLPIFLVIVIIGASATIVDVCHHPMQTSNQEHAFIEPENISLLPSTNEALQVISSNHTNRDHALISRGDFTIYTWSDTIIQIQTSHEREFLHIHVPFVDVDISREGLLAVLLSNNRIVFYGKTSQGWRNINECDSHSASRVRVTRNHLWLVDDTHGRLLKAPLSEDDIDRVIDVIDEGVHSEDIFTSSSSGDDCLYSWNSQRNQIINWCSLASVHSTDENFGDLTQLALLDDSHMVYAHEDKWCALVGRQTFYCGSTRDSQIISSLDINDNGVIVLGVPDRRRSVTARGAIEIHRRVFPLKDPLESTSHLEIQSQEYSLKSRLGSHVIFGRSGSGGIIASAPSPDEPLHADIRMWRQWDVLEETCTDCEGIYMGEKRMDECGICGGDSTTCIGCDGERDSPKRWDVCGVCGGDHTSCFYVEEIQVTLHDGSMLRHVVQQISPSHIHLEDSICLHEVATFRVSVGKSRSSVSWMERDSDGCHPLEGCSMNIRSMEDNEIIFSASPEGTSLKHVYITFDVKDCVGCDGRINSGLWFDSCGVCDGDESQCHDCAGVLNGTHIVDECGVCVDPLGPSTCFEVEKHMSDVWIVCSHTLRLSYAPQHTNERIVRWSIINQTQAYNHVHIDRRSGIFEYTSVRRINVDHQVCYRGVDQYNNQDEGCVTFRVRECDVPGCDGILGSGKTIDQCSVCSTEDDRDHCVDCAGIPWGLHTIRSSDGVCILDLDGNFAQNQEEEEAAADGSTLSTLSIVVISVFGIGVAVLVVGGVVLFFFI